MKKHTQNEIWEFITYVLSHHRLVTKLDWEVEMLVVMLGCQSLKLNLGAVSTEFVKLKLQNFL